MINFLCICGTQKVEEFNPYLFPLCSIYPSSGADLTSDLQKICLLLAHREAYVSRRAALFTLAAANKIRAQIISSML